MKKIALTCGDPAGIGPEIISRFLAENTAIAGTLVPIGPQRWLDAISCAGVSVGEKDFRLTPGEPSAAGQHIALDAMEYAAAGTLSGEFSAVVTAPVNKAQLQSIGYRFPGQTEFFAEKWKGVPVMAFAGGKMRVALATWHIPFTSVLSALNFETLERTVTQADFLARKLCKETSGAFPRIAVCGLNPHAGEQGILGREEIDHLEPILEKLRTRFHGLSHCVPADTVFRRHLLGEFDVVVALYHDQALAPLKTLEFEESVNISLGLPHIRTSPDHGTAYEIAGKNLAQIKSLSNAVRIARELAS